MGNCFLVLVPFPIFVYNKKNVNVWGKESRYEEAQGNLSADPFDFSRLHALPG